MKKMSYLEKWVNTLIGILDFISLGRTNPNIIYSICLVSYHIRKITVSHCYFQNFTVKPKIDILVNMSNKMNLVMRAEIQNEATKNLVGWQVITS